MIFWVTRSRSWAMSRGYRELDAPLRAFRERFPAHLDADRFTLDA
jgi:hypothetical protein